MIYVFYILPAIILAIIAFFLLVPTSLVLSVSRSRPGAPLRLYASWAYIAKTLGIAFYWQHGGAKKTSLLIGGRPWRRKRRPTRSRPSGQQASTPPPAAPQKKSPAKPDIAQEPKSAAPKTTPGSKAEPTAKTTADHEGKPTAKKAVRPRPKIAAARQYAGKRIEKWSKRELLALAQGPGLTLLKRLYRTLRLKDLRIQGYLGLENPAHTGQIMALILLFEELGFDKIRLDLKPTFDQVGLGGSLRLRGRLHLGYLLFSLLCFIVPLAVARLGSRLRDRAAGTKTVT